MIFKIVPQSLLFACLLVDVFCRVQNSIKDNDSKIITSTEKYGVNNGNDTAWEPIDTRTDGRIVNGTKADLKQFPHQVSLRRTNSQSHFCGANVIDKDWILTAAHCMFTEDDIQITPDSLVVIAGQSTLFPQRYSSQKRYVKTIIVHEDFDNNDLSYDIALLKLASPLRLKNGSIQVAKLADKLPVPGTVCEVSGWGYLSEYKHQVSNDLMYVSLPIINRTRCQQLFQNRNVMHEGHFCAGYEEGLMDSCQGDSGGGMICGNVLSGLVSYGWGCARPKLPGTYSDISYFRSWISTNIKNYEEIDESSDKNVPILLPVFGRYYNDAGNIRSFTSFYLLVPVYLFFVLKM